MKQERDLSKTEASSKQIKTKKIIVSISSGRFVTFSLVIYYNESIEINFNITVKAPHMPTKRTLN
jgi:hypothetical protein